eukprot:1146700-Pelagomonas_calceolata.AAC.7
MAASGKVHRLAALTAQRTLHPQALTGLLNNKFRQHCSVRVAVEAKAVAVETHATCFTGSSWPEPASLPSTLKLGTQAQQGLLPGSSSFGDFWSSGKSHVICYYAWQLREGGGSLSDRPLEQLQLT